MNEYKTYLCHHGVRGMRWGVRRYQNKDGSLTERGKTYRITVQKTKRAAANVRKTGRAVFTASKAIGKHTAATVKIVGKHSMKAAKTVAPYAKSGIKISAKIAGKTLKETGIITGKAALTVADVTTRPLRAEILDNISPSFLSDKQLRHRTERIDAENKFAETKRERHPFIKKFTDTQVEIATQSAKSAAEIFTRTVAQNAANNLTKKDESKDENE